MNGIVTLGFGVVIALFYLAVLLFSPFVVLSLIMAEAPYLPPDLWGFCAYFEYGILICFLAIFRVQR